MIATALTWNQFRDGLLWFGAYLTLIIILTGGIADEGKKK